jgi:hypothetical protein
MLYDSFQPEADNRHRASLLKRLEELGFVPMRGTILRRLQPPY